MTLYVDNDNEIIVASYRESLSQTPVTDAALTGHLVDASPGAFGAIANATSASPIVITSAAHGLTTGAQVVIVQVEAPREALGLHTITRINADTFSLDGTTGTGTWIATDAKSSWHKHVSTPSFVYDGTNHRYVALVAYTLPLVAQRKYKIILDSDKGDHWEIEETAVVRR